MTDIKIYFTIGDKQSELVLSSPLGGPGGYHIMVNKFYHGKACKMLDGWHVYTNENSFLIAEDFDVILDVIKSVQI